MLMDIVTAPDNGYFISATEAKKIVSVTLLPLQRHKKLYRLLGYCYRGIINFYKYFVNVNKGKY